ncbi:class I SAM-dependent methyltransferase [Microbacterium sp. LTA6]|uniref:class I SAM-dependent methyltransferase n=1 Tax=Microbacterium sp. LTA6 TaxID=3129771 RepID=UPI00325049C0
MSDLHTSADSGIAAAYDARAAEYIHLAGAVEQMAPADRALITRWRDATPGTLLDAGCGPGHWTALLHDGDREVVGVDLSAEFLVSARAAFPHLRFLDGTFRDLPFPDGSIGGILAWYSLIHTPPADIPVVLAEFARVLASDGSILLGFFDGVTGTAFPHAVTTAYFWSVDALAEVLAEAGFEIVEQEHRDRGPDEPSRRPHGAVLARRV